MIERDGLSNKNVVRNIRDRRTHIEGHGVKKLSPYTVYVTLAATYTNVDAVEAQNILD